MTALPSVQFCHPGKELIYGAFTLTSNKVSWVCPNSPPEIARRWTRAGDRDPDPRGTKFAKSSPRIFGVSHPRISSVISNRKRHDTRWNELRKFWNWNFKFQNWKNKIWIFCFCTFRATQFSADLFGLKSRNLSLVRVRICWRVQ